MQPNLAIQLTTHALLSHVSTSYLTPVQFAPCSLRTSIQRSDTGRVIKNSVLPSPIKTDQLKTKQSCYGLQKRDEASRRSKT